MGGPFKIARFRSVDPEIPQEITVTIDSTISGSPDFFKGFSYGTWGSDPW